MFGGGKLAAVIIEPVESLDAVHQLPRLARAHDGDGKADRVERHIVLAHEFVIADVFRVVPPRLPRIALAVRVGPFLCRADIFDGCVEPDVKHLALELAVRDVVRHRHAPIDIARDAAILQSLFQPFVGDGPDKLRPFVLVTVDPCAQLRHELRLLQEQMRGVADLDVIRTRHCAARLDEIDGIQNTRAVLALVAARLFVAAMRACADDIAVRQEAAVGIGIDLLRRADFQKAVLPELAREMLRQFPVLRA